MSTRYTFIDHESDIAVLREAGGNQYERGASEKHIGYHGGGRCHVLRAFDGKGRLPTSVVRRGYARCWKRDHWSIQVDQSGECTFPLLLPNFLRQDKIPNSGRGLARPVHRDKANPRDGLGAGKVTSYVSELDSAILKVKILLEPTRAL